MSKKMAVLNEELEVINIIIAEDNTEETDFLFEYSDSNPAYIGGDWVGGFFYPPQPHKSWTRNEGIWLAPSPKPQDEGFWIWNENELIWESIQIG